MNIKEIAEKLDELSSDYEIGNLQEIRKNLKNLSRRASSTIFTSNTISEDQWAFHYGGRKELQFNIGFEEEGLRYGVAFSLETSRTLPDINLLFPKILKLNSLIIGQPELFFDYKMWYWQDHKRCETSNVFQIDEKLTKNGTFIFIGKIMDPENIDYHEILRTYDDLLKIYIEVENESYSKIHNTSLENNEFVFVKGKTNLPQNTNYTRTQQQIIVNARHSFLQEQLYNRLVSAFGENCVGMENYINGKKIDIVLKTKNVLIFYEIKTSNTAKQCIREALGQILEYTYYDSKKIAQKIVIAGEYPIDVKTRKYLQFLNSEFNLPLQYHKIKITS